MQKSNTVKIWVYPKQACPNKYLKRLLQKKNKYICRGKMDNRTKEKQKVETIN